MQNGTAVGLLVGGAILLLAASPRPQTVATANGAALQPAAGGMLNPFNWLGGVYSGPAQAPQPQAQAMPALSPPPNAGGNYASGAQSPRAENAAFSPANTAMGSPAYGSPSFQNASYTQPYQSPNNYSPMYASPFGYDGMGGGGGSPAGGYQYASAPAASPSYSPSYSV